MRTRKPRARPQTYVLLGSTEAQDQALIGERLDAISNDIQLDMINDSEQMLAYLEERSLSVYDFPRLVLLDTTLLTDDGEWRLVKDIKKSFPALPLVLLGKDGPLQTLERAYQLGAQTFLTKAATVEAWTQQLDALTEYWFSTVSLPKYRADWAGDC